MFKQRIFVCADIHGNPRVIQHIINSIDNPTENDIIIIAGDAGFEYGACVMGNAKKAAKKFPGKWIVMRGNHDNCYMRDHSYYSEKEKRYITQLGWSYCSFMGLDNYIYQNKYPNILYTEDDGGIYTIGGYNFLFLPGAYSVDKNYRLLYGYPYNEDEQLTVETMKELYSLVEDWNNKEFPIDYVIGHTFPKKLEPYYNILFMDGIDQSKVDTRTEQWLDSMSKLFENNYAFKQYYGGHFHGNMSLTDKYTMVYQSPIEIGK